MLPKLLELFRSGALSSLLSGSPLVVPHVEVLPVSPPAAVVPDSIRKAKSKLKNVSPVVPPADVGWVPVNRAKARAVDTKDKLVPGGWSVAVKSGVSELITSEPGVCLASVSEAKKVVAELKGAHPLAILSPANINGAGQEIHVLVEDPTGRWQSRRRFLFQVGTGSVTYMNGSAKKPFKPDSVKVVLSFGKQHTEPDAWCHALTNAQALTKKWLHMRAKVEFLDVRQPTRLAGVPDMLQVIVTLPISSWTQILRSSGLDGVFVRPFVESNQDKLAIETCRSPQARRFRLQFGKLNFLEKKHSELYLMRRGLAFV